MRLIWNPAWHPPGASLWSLAAKMAYATTTTVGDVLHELLGLTSVAWVTAWTGTPEGRADAVSALSLGAAGGDGLFTSFSSGDNASLSNRQHLHVRLRWCPTCAAQWYHSAHFQDRRVARCPWHGEPLAETCPKCGRPVDPYGVPWTCSHCRLKLSGPLGDWLRDFKVHPRHDGRWPMVLPEQCLAYQDQVGGVASMADAQALERVRNVHGHALAHWDLAQAWEAACALWDTVLADHVECAELEPHNYFGEHFYRGEFVCPVAAAATATFKRLSIAESRDPRTQVRNTQLPHHQPYVQPESVSLSARRILVQEFVRSWLGDALLFYSEAARAGWTNAVWQPHADALKATVTATDKGFTAADFVTTRSTRWVEATKLFAAERCPRKPALDLRDAASWLLQG